MSEPLDERYFVHLYSQVGDLEAKNPAHTHWKLTRQLFKKEFFWFVPNDDNRIADGLELRNEFVEEVEHGIVDPNWLLLGCSMMELMIGLARRLSFEAEGEPSYWFWHLVNNLDLYKYTDLHRSNSKAVDNILDTVILRTYQDDGRGGFFPLEYPTQNQREVELWYQMNSYVLEADERRTSGFLRS